MKTNSNVNIRWLNHQIKRTKNIVRVSVELFSTKGYLETRMDDIARTLRITKGGIYHYFHSKEEILYSICSTCTELKLRDLESVLADTEGGAKAVRLVIFHLVDHCTRNVKGVKTSINELRNLSPKHLKIISAMENRCHEIATEAIANFLGQSPNNEIAKALSLAFSGIVDRLCFQYSSKIDMGSEASSEFIFTLFINWARDLAPVLPLEIRERWGLKRLILRDTSSLYLRNHEKQYMNETTCYVTQ